MEKKKIFHDLFLNFNERYDRLNESLNRIKEGKEIPMTGLFINSNYSTSEEFSFQTKNIIYDYLNLCAEEHFWYKEGMIHPTIWDNWKKGIECFLNSETIIEVINKEREKIVIIDSENEFKINDNYYGFLFSEIVFKIIMKEYK